MTTGPTGSARKVVLLSLLLYLGLWLAEAVAKTLAIAGEYTPFFVTSSVSAKLVEGARMFADDAALYILKLVLVYALFALLNARYALLLDRRLEPRQARPGRRPAAAGRFPWPAFLAVNGTFLAAVYALNAALYPASALALVRGSLGLGADAAALRTAAVVLLVLYLLGFLALNLRPPRRPAAAAALSVWAVLLLAPLDPAHHLRQALQSGGRSVNAGPNVVLIGLDSLNPLHTGYAGYPLPLTPNLDAFMRENVVFENCYTPIARTFPAWYSILTGQYPVTSGVRLNLQKRKHIRSAERCLGHVLRAEGYRTLHFTDEVRFSNITAEEGFDVLRRPTMGVRDFLFGTFHDFSLTNVFLNNPLGFRIFPFLEGNRAVSHLYGGRYFVNDLVAAVGRLRRERRFFLAAHLCIAHWPYHHASPREHAHRPGADPRLSLYDSAVGIVDAQLGRVLDALKAAGLYDNSIVVVLSDHGESAEGHGSDLRNSEQNRTLLVWKPAGPAVHRDVGRLARTIDIAPTVLDLLGLGAEGRAFDGLSLRPWIAGQAPPPEAEPASVIMETEFSLETPGGIGLAVQEMVEQGAEFYEFDRDGLVTVRDEFHDVLIRRRHRAILTPEWKLVRDVFIRAGEERVRTSLFDVRKDPRCTTDVAAERPEVFRDLWERLRRYYGPEIGP